MIPILSYKNMRSNSYLGSIFFSSLVIQQIASIDSNSTYQLQAYNGLCLDSGDAMHTRYENSFGVWLCELDKAILKNINGQCLHAGINEWDFQDCNGTPEQEFQMKPFEAPDQSNEWVAFYREKGGEYWCLDYTNAFHRSLCDCKGDICKNANRFGGNPENKAFKFNVLE
jgi:hypothetical protein